MNNLQEQLDERLEALRDQKDRVKDLIMIIHELEQSLAEFKVELKDIMGSFFQPGQIHGLKDSIRTLELKVKHEAKPKVVWTDEANSWDADKVVHKVTEKSIYICRPGHVICDMYEKDGKAVGYGPNTINIEATFGGPCPETLK